MLTISNLDASESRQVRVHTTRTIQEAAPVYVMFRAAGPVNIQVTSEGRSTMTATKLPSGTEGYAVSDDEDVQMRCLQIMEGFVPFTFLLHIW